ncbi:MAG: hypothetical protein PHI23_04640, partial [Candidatus Peribacteraceae bacterium]|nr:hypothetical protein [Candidatus Peribacteraceae bacterium]
AVKSLNAGGVSGEQVQILSFAIHGIGEWSWRSYDKSSIESYSLFETARSVVTDITNPGPETDVLITGAGQRIGSFRFAGKRGDGAADLAVTDLTFQIGATGGASLSNVQLATDGLSDRVSCSVLAGNIICSNISATFGSFEDAPRTLTLYATVTVPPTSINSYVQLFLTPAGDSSSAGAVTWTDGTSSFSWVPFDSPIASGTKFER